MCLYAMCTGAYGAQMNLSETMNIELQVAMHCSTVYCEPNADLLQEEKALLTDKSSQILMFTIKT